MEENRNARQSNFEALRIVSMFLIVCFHYALKAEWNPELGLSQELARKIYLIFGEMGVNCFMLITGYFLIRGRRKWRNVICMIAQSVFYTVLAGVILLPLGEFPFAGKGMLVMVMPEIFNVYWFVTVYLLIYILSPYLNLMLLAMDQKTMREFLGISLLIWSVIPSGYQFYFGNTETGLYYSRFVWMVIVYGIGAYIRRFGFMGEKKKAGAYAAACIAVMISVTMITTLFPDIPVIRVLGMRQFWPLNSVCMIVLSVMVFETFRNFQLGSVPMVNWAARTTLGIYMLHDGLAGTLLWRTVDGLTAGFRIHSALLIPMVACVIFLMGMIVELVRIQLFRGTDAIIRKLKIRHMSGSV